MGTIGKEKRDPPRHIIKEKLLFKEALTHRRGLEPPTTWSEARYSIQLSYRCLRRELEALTQNFNRSGGETQVKLRKRLSIVLTSL